jgi:hypothetical protein
MLQMVTQCSHQNGGHIQWAMDLLAQRCRAIFLVDYPGITQNIKKLKKKGLEQKL